MAVYMTDMEPQLTTQTVAHIRRSVEGENLCGSRFGMGFKFDEGEELEGPWPYDVWCATCAAAHKAGAV